MISIRSASVADARAIAEVLVRSWRATYPGIVAQSYIDGMSTEAQTLRWQKRLSDGDLLTAVVAHDPNGRIVGFAAGGRLRERHADFDGELYALYLIPEAKGRGIGRKLLSEWALQAKSRGYNAAIARVFTANPACAFYEHLGAHAVKEAILELEGESYPETWYAWDDLGALTA